MVGEVGLADAVQTGHRGHQVVVHPEATHRVVDGRVDPHGLLVRVLTGDPVVHVEQVSVFVRYGFQAITGNGRSEVQVHAVLQRPDSTALVAHRLGIAGRYVPGHQVAEGRVLTLQVVVTFGLGDVGRGAGIVECCGNPDPAVVAERLGHQCQLRLEVIADRNARRVYLGVAGVSEEGSLLVGTPGCRDVAHHGVGGQEVDVAVAAGGQNHGVGRMRSDLAREQIAGDDPTGPAVFLDHVK